MNKVFLYAVIINLALLLVFILLDALTWNSAALSLDSTIKAIVKANGNVVGAYSSYTTAQVGITVRYYLAGLFGHADSSGTSVNLPLMWFILTIAVNLFFIWYLGTKRVNDLGRKPRTESASSSL